MDTYPVPSADTTDPIVCSFDVFDTVLTRAVSPPTAAFLLIEQRPADALPPGYTARTFAEARRSAEQRALAWHGARTTLNAIYEELRATMPDADWARIQRTELEVERTLLAPVPVGRDLLQQCREAGHTVVFVSDMYLPAAFIQEQLETHGLWQTGDRLFVSCEHGFQKGDGLFDVVCTTLGVAPGALTHYGNCPHADVRGAKAHGSTGLHVTEANPSRYEQTLERHAQHTEGASALIAGAARHARLHTRVSTQHEKALRDVAAGVVAPLCTGFVLWLLKQAQAHNLKRLYFTARDGYVLFPIAQRLASLLGIDCEMRYLYLSRVAVTGAYPDPEVVCSTWDYYEKTSGEDLLARLNLTVEDIRPFLSSKSEYKQVTRFPITDRGKEILRSVLDRISEGQIHIDALDRNRQLLIDYLDQEGITEDGRFGFVDIGWKGSIHTLLNALLLDEKVISDPIPGFYFGLNKKKYRYADYRTAYFFDESRKVGTNPLPGGDISTVMEMFCTANHGTVTSYERKNSRVFPVLESMWSKRMDDWGFPVVQRTLGVFVNSLSDHGLLTDHHVDIRAALADLLRAFWKHPTTDEARAWGDFPLELSQGTDQRTSPLACSLGPSALLEFARYGGRAYKRLGHELTWSQASLERSGPWLQHSIKYIVGARETAKRIAYAAQR